MSSPPPAEESVVQHASRSCKNGFFACFGFTKKSGPLAKIKYKETQISSRQRTFGTEYFALLEKGATEEELKACVETAQKDIKTIEAEIKDLEEQAAAIDKETESKIVKPGSATAGTAAATSEPAVVESTTPETSKPEPPKVEASASAPEPVKTKTEAPAPEVKVEAP